jgi:hypothetical protein
MEEANHRHDGHDNCFDHPSKIQRMPKERRTDRMRFEFEYMSVLTSFFSLSSVYRVFFEVNKTLFITPLFRE